VLGLLVNAMWWHAARGHRLLGPHVTKEAARRLGRRYLVGPAGYALATLVALVFPPAALGVFVLLNVFFLWPRKETGAEPGDGARVS